MVARCCTAGTTPGQHWGVLFPGSNLDCFKPGKVTSKCVSIPENYIRAVRPALSTETRLILSDLFSERPVVLVWPGSFHTSVSHRKRATIQSPGVGGGGAGVLVADKLFISCRACTKLFIKKILHPPPLEDWMVASYVPCQTCHAKADSYSKTHS